MPYDTKGRWIPPDDAEGDWADWDNMTLEDFEDLIEKGDLAGVGLADMAAVRNRFNTEDWRMLDDNQKLGVLQEYQRVYSYMSDSTRLDDQWGMDLERLEDSDMWEDDGDLDVNSWFEHHSNRSGDGHKIDYAHYNDDRLYQAARKALMEGTDEQKAIWGGGDWNDLYEKEEQLRAASEIIKGWNKEEKEKQEEWAKENVTPYNETEAHLRMFQQTQKFDPVTKTMYTYESERKKGAIDPNNPSHNALTIKQHLPPAPPSELTVVKGNAPTPTYNADGVRVAGVDDVIGWYKQYLGRDVDASNEWVQNWAAQAGQGKSFEWVQGQIMNSPEAHGKGNKDFGAAYYNPETYGSEASITAKMVEEPAKVQAPTITIRDIGEPKKPTRSYMALNDTVWTDPSVDKRSTRWSPSAGKRVSTGHTRKDAEFLTKAPVTGGT